MSDQPEAVSGADCVLCRQLGHSQRAAMQADLLQIPLGEPVCDQCTEAFCANLFARIPETEEERLRRRGEIAAGGSRSRQ
jgi:hypothetical protein